jgi:hypothetical protein
MKRCIMKRNGGSVKYSMKYTNSLPGGLSDAPKRYVLHTWFGAIDMVSVEASESN